MSFSRAELQLRSRRIRWLLLDVDGVLTDGQIHCWGDGAQGLAFDVKDGLALVLAREAGLEIGLLSGRDVPVVRQRADQLGITTLMLGIADKEAEFDRFLAEHDLESQEVAYVGDDLPDLSVLRRCGLSMAPADAAQEVASSVHLVLDRPGGRGAVRAAVEALLRARGDWAALVRRHGG